jgi:hypothetical protein
VYNFSCFVFLSCVAVILDERLCLDGVVHMRGGDFWHTFVILSFAAVKMHSFNCVWYLALHIIEVISHTKFPVFLATSGNARRCSGGNFEMECTPPHNFVFNCVVEKFHPP